MVERAGGSKATVYALFESKEGLFAALVAEAAEELSALVQSYPLDGKIEDDLRDFGIHYLEILIRPERLALFRLVLGECGRVPEVGEIFFRTGPQVIFRKVADMLRSAAARGQIDISDAEGMAHFFIDALRGHVHMEVMLNPTRRPTQKEIERHVDFVVANFLRACRPPARYPRLRLFAGAFAAVRLAGAAIADRLLADYAEILRLGSRLARSNPSAARPRFSNSRTAAARLGILVVNRQSSTAFNSSSVSMICRRSPRLSSPIAPSRGIGGRIM